jgi:DNA-binding FadR family transcriptional regulator
MSEAGEQRGAGDRRKGADKPERRFRLKGNIVKKPPPIADDEQIPPKSAARGGMTAVRVPKTGEIVADQIRRRIVRGELPEGSFLPSENELTETFNISRPTLREAVRVLEAERLVSVGRGSRTGAKVLRPRFESVARYAGFALQVEETTMGDIYSARLAIEPFVARTLAEKMAAEAADRLDAKIEELKAQVESASHIDFIVGVAEFHSLLVELSGSKTLLMITQMLQEIVIRYQVRFISFRKRTPEERYEIGMTGIRSFRILSGLIREAKGEEAEAHWRRHLQVTNQVWLRDGLDGQIIDMFD